MGLCASYIFVGLESCSPTCKQAVSYRSRKTWAAHKSKGIELNIIVKICMRYFPLHNQTILLVSEYGGLKSNFFLLLNLFMYRDAISNFKSWVRYSITLGMIELSTALLLLVATLLTCFLTTVMKSSFNYCGSHLY